MNRLSLGTSTSGALSIVFVAVFASASFAQDPDPVLGLRRALDGGVKPGQPTAVRPGAAIPTPPSNSATTRAPAGISNAPLGAEPVAANDPARAPIEEVLNKLTDPVQRRTIEDALRRGGPIVSDGMSGSVADPKPMPGSTRFRLPLGTRDSNTVLSALQDFKARNPNARLGDLVPPGVPEDPAKARIWAVLWNNTDREQVRSIEDAIRRGGPIVSETMDGSVADDRPVPGSKPYRLPLPPEDATEILKALQDFKARNPGGRIADLVSPGVPADPARARLEFVFRNVGADLRKSIERALREGRPVESHLNGRAISDGTPSSKPALSLMSLGDDAAELFDALEDFKARNPGARFAELVDPWVPDLGDRLSKAMSALPEADRKTLSDFYGVEGPNALSDPVRAAGMARAMAELKTRHPDADRTFAEVYRDPRFHSGAEFANLVARVTARQRLR